MRTAKHIISASAAIPAAPQTVYRLIADYRNGHPRILPPQFSGMTVERGGTGAGTIVAFRLRLLGRTQRYRAAVTEPEPGRVLVETDLDTNGAVTTFYVDPVAEGAHAQVTITTELPVRDGILGALERRVTTGLLRPIYLRELSILAAVAQQPAAC